MRLLVKRMLDIIGALLLLLTFGWVMALVAIAIARVMGRPVLFRQVRPGRQGRLFTIYKFRTMAETRDADGSPLPDGQRLTRLGRIIRSLSLDELPQLFNVLAGDMSLIGPRPLLLEYLPRYDDRQRRRHDMPPGITGWAQVNGRNAISWPERLELDVWYVEHWSLALDARIALLTAAKVFLRSGVSAPGEATVTEFKGNTSDASASSARKAGG